MLLFWLSGITVLRLWIRFLKITKSQKLEILLSEKLKWNRKIVLAHISENYASYRQKGNLATVGGGKGLHVALLDSSKHCKIALKDIAHLFVSKLFFLMTCVTGYKSLGPMTLFILTQINLHDIPTLGWCPASNICIVGHHF